MAKVSKPSVHYRAANWWERFVERRTCGDCSMFRPRAGGGFGACTLVAGKIAAGDVCDRWEPK